MLPFKQLEAVKKQLDRFFYTAGTNIALFNALERKESKSFQTKVTRALTLQILHIAQLEKIFAILQTLKKQEDQISDQIQTEWLPFDKALIQGKITILLFLLFAADVGGQTGLDKIVPQFNFKLRNKKFKDQLQARTNFLIEALDKTSINWIVKNIEEGIKNNLTALQIVKLLRQEAKSVAQLRGELITENELTITMNLLELEVFRKNGIKKVSWHTALDERVEEICLANEAAGAIPIGTEFPMGQANPPAHGRCRCFLLPELPSVIEGSIWTGE